MEDAVGDRVSALTCKDPEQDGDVSLGSKHSQAASSLDVLELIAAKLQTPRPRQLCEQKSSGHA